MPTDKPSWLSVTNLLVTIALAINAIIFTQLQDINSKMFMHLTNASLHIPRETVVSKDEFIIYQTMRDKQMSDMKDLLCELKYSLNQNMGNSNVRDTICKDDTHSKKGI